MGRAVKTLEGILEIPWFASALSRASRVVNSQVKSIEAERYCESLSTSLMLCTAIYFQLLEGRKKKELYFYSNSQRNFFFFQIYFWFSNDGKPMISSEKIYFKLRITSIKDFRFYNDVFKTRVEKNTN